MHKRFSYAGGINSRTPNPGWEYRVLDFIRHCTSGKYINTGTSVEQIKNHSSMVPDDLLEDQLEKWAEEGILQVECWSVYKTTEKVTLEFMRSLSQNQNYNQVHWTALKQPDHAG